MPPKPNVSAPQRILLLSEGIGSEIYAGAFEHAFQTLGHTVKHIQWKTHFQPCQGPLNRLSSLYYRAQSKFTFGPTLLKMNDDIVAQAKAFKPDLIFVYRGTHIWPCTLKRLKKATGAKVFGYNNDDPFSPNYPAYFWRHFRHGIPHYDHIFAYRTKNIADYAAMGYPHTSLLRSYFIKGSNTRITPKPSNNRFVCDVIFIGHYEADGRDDTLMLLITNGINVKLYGTLWEKSPHYEALKSHMGGSIQPLYKADYNLALNSAKIALVFLSKLNNDSYTRRCFEIPATGTLMASEYTEDLATNLYKPNEEAIYFTSKEELLTQLQTLLANPKKLKDIADAGHARMLHDGHEVTDRAQQVLALFHSF